MVAGDSAEGITGSAGMSASATGSGSGHGSGNAACASAATPSKVFPEEGALPALLPKVAVAEASGPVVQADAGGTACGKWHAAVVHLRPWPLPAIVPSFQPSR